MGDRDLLYALRNNFHLGAYQAAIGEANDLQHDDLGERENVERDIFMYRAYIEMGKPEEALSGINDDAPLALQAVKGLARLRTDPDAKEEVVASIAEWLSDPAYSSNLMLSELAGEVFCAAEKYEDALKCCSSGGSLELLAIGVHVALKMERADLAKRLADAMSAKDDDAPLTQLAAAWVSVALGGDHVQEAQYIYQELGDRFNWTPKLLNGSACTLMIMGAFPEAEKQLMEALAKDANDGDTLANLAVCNLHLGRAPAAAKYLAQLKAQGPTHPVIAKLGSLEDKFQHAAAQFI